jgi:outer membrane protein assembly factor BamA
MLHGLRLKPYLILLLAIIASSCSNTKHLPKDENLFVGSKINIKDKTTSRKVKRILRRDIAGGVTPRANSTSFGMRIKLSLYYLGGGEKKTGGFQGWIKKLGEPPVLQSSVKLDINEKLMENMLQNRGFFHADAVPSWKVRRRKARAIFDITTGPQYKINTVVLQKDPLPISEAIDSSFKETLLKKGEPYNLDLIKAERQRIDRMLKERGYFFFKPDYVLVLADTSLTEHKVNMAITLKHAEMPYNAYQAYNINDIYIYTNYRIRGNHEDTSKQYMEQKDSYYIIDKRKRYKPFVLADAMIFEKGDIYSLDDQNTSLSRLINMGTFKFVKNRFDPVGDSLLDVYYYLTPFPRKSIRFEIGALTQNDNSTGTRGSLSWRHRNLMRGAEALQIKLHYGVETQVSNGPTRQPGINTYGVEVNFSFPRFIIPFFDIQTQSRYLPRTVIRAKYNYEFQRERIGIASFMGGYGYNWKQGPKAEHQLFPIDITYVQTDTLGNKEQIYYLYTNLLFDGLILGPTYNFIYNSQVGKTKKNGFYFSGKIDMSGNVFSSLSNQQKTNTQEILGVHYAEYIKLEPDVRYYWHISPSTTIASRAMLGLGIPYGNSTILPNIKQYWAGGNSDLRGFPSRLLGPGTFNERAMFGTNRLFQTLGDLKMEMNLELRQHIHKMINLGLFVEAGNIWLYKKNPAFPGGEFTSDFLNQLAADVGFGLRLDFQVILLRFDLGIPVRKPWEQANNSFVLNQIDFSNARWRSDNLILNIAIGYPF